MLQNNKTEIKATTNDESATFTIVKRQVRRYHHIYEKNFGLQKAIENVYHRSSFPKIKPE